jgi:hypothetical protein
MGTRSVATGLAIAAVLGLTGCGDSAPSKSEFILKADALCAETNKANPQPPQPTTANEAATQAAREVRVRTALDKKLRDLKVPGEVKSDFASYNAQTVKLIALLRQQQAAAKANSESRFTALGQQFNTVAKARGATATKIGF